MDRISCDECIRLYKIEKNLLEHLVDTGIVCYHYEENIQYIQHEHLPLVERYARMHYDLQVNLEGIDIIHQLLEKIERLERENTLLNQRLRN